MSDHAVSQQGHWMTLAIKLQDITSHHIPADCTVTAHHYDNRKLRFLCP